MAEVERQFLISLLKLTKDGPAARAEIIKDAKVASTVASSLLLKLQTEKIVYVENDGAVHANGPERLVIACKAVSLGVDPEGISKFLRWQEFESVSAIALEQNGYVVSRNVRFKALGRRWEMDLVGCKKPIVLCIDCKHWHRGTGPSSIRRIVEAQAERTRAFSESLPDISHRLACCSWTKAKFLPAVVLLISGSLKFYEKVPIVPVLQLQDFLHQLPAYAESLKYFMKNFTHLDPVAQGFTSRKNC